MILVDIVRNKTPVVMTPYRPFVYIIYTNYRELRDEWGESADDIFAIVKREKVLQVTRDYLTKYLEQATLADCITQESSFYFDRVNQLIYVHVEHGYIPVIHEFDYGTSFGACNEGVTYVDDFEYLPVIDSAPAVEQSADVVGISEPVGVTGTMTLINNTIIDEENERIGILDFLLDENIYGNDVFLSYYDGETVTGISSFYIENMEYSQESVILDLQTRRFT